jgi:hypothetical protein
MLRGKVVTCSTITTSPGGVFHGEWDAVPRVRPAKVVAKLCEETDAACCVGERFSV